jgi:tetratricopeptide (TPR) repeat protein
MDKFTKKIAFIICCFLVSFSILFANGVLQEAQELYDSGNYQEALALVKPLLEENPELGQALILAGKIYFKMGYLEEAKEKVDKAIEVDRANEDYRDVRNEMASFGSLVNEASRLKKDGNYVEAKDKFAALLVENPNFAEGHFQYAQVLLQLNEAKTGAEELKKAIELRPEEEKYQQAYNHFVQKSLYDGNQFLKRRSYRRAQEQFEKALTLDPNQHLAHFFLARTYYAERNYAKALESANKCIELQDDYINAYIVKGNVLMRMNKMNESLATFKQVTEIEKENISAWDKIGYINYMTKNYEAAIPAYMEVIELKPDYDKPYENLGAIYSEQKDWDKAIEYLKKASELNPNDESTWYRLAVAYNAKGMAEKAKEAANKSLAKKPGYAPSLIELGSAERRLGNKDAARNAFRMAANDPKWKKLAEFELESVK